MATFSLPLHFLANPLNKNLPITFAFISFFLLANIEEKSFCKENKDNIDDYAIWIKIQRKWKKPKKTRIDLIYWLYVLKKREQQLQYKYIS